MFGRLVNGQEAEKGTIMLGEIEVVGRPQRVMATPVRLNGEPHCLIVPSAGFAFVPTSAWIRKVMWDVTPDVEFLVDPQRFVVSSEMPKHGEIAWREGDWLIAVALEEHRRDRLDWVNIALGEPVQHRGETMLRFPSWRLARRVGEREPETIFQPSGPAAEPSIRRLG